MTDDEYAGLSPEEIAAIKGDDEGGSADAEVTLDNKKDNNADDSNPDEAKAEANEPDKSGDAQSDDSKPDSDDRSGDQAGDEAGSSSGDEKPDTTPVEGDEKAGDDETDKGAGDDKADVAAQQQRPFVPQFTEGDPAELEKLKTAVDEAKQQFDDGNLDYAAFSEIKDAYTHAQWKSEFAVESNKNMREERWRWEQDRFLDDNQTFRDNSTLNLAFIGVVNKIIATEEGAKLSDREVLLKAKDQIQADLGIFSGTGDAGTSEKDKKKQQAIANAKHGQADRSKIGADIGSLPTAKENADESVFAYLDKLDGEAYQLAIDKMTPDQLQKYEDS